MPEIQIRPVVADDIPVLVALDHDYVSDIVWQMDVQQPEEGQIALRFRQLRLPRSIKVDYPRSRQALLNDWTNRSVLLAALMQDEVVGYAGLVLSHAPYTTWVTDLAVLRRVRRQGVGSVLVLAAQEWARQQNTNRLILEMQPKNYPAICLAQKLGFDFCGYQDRYFPNQDIALFFSHMVR